MNLRNGRSAIVQLQNVFTDLVRFQIELWNAIDARLRIEVGLPLGSYETLDVLERRGPCRVQDIAGDLIVTVGGVSKLVDRVEERGLCRRRSNPDDRRSSLVELTPEGSALHHSASKIVDTVLSERLGDVLPSESVDQFAGTLRTLRSASRATSTLTLPRKAR